MFSLSHVNEMPAFSNYSGLKIVFDKLRFRDGLVWTVGLTGEIKLRFYLHLINSYLINFLFIMHVVIVIFYVYTGR